MPSSKLGHIRIDPEPNRKFKALAKLHRRSVQSQGEIAIEEHLKRHAADVKKALALFPEKE